MCIAVLLFVGCTPDAKPEPGAFEGLHIPAAFPAPHYGVGDSRLEASKVALGRKLFYDPILSKSGTISCQSCHQQAAAFSDAGKALSAGEGGQLGRRNAPALFNLAWHPYFMADGGINHIEVMPIAPITDSLEMGETLTDVVAKLQASAGYRSAFEEAFGEQEVSAQHMLVALAQFLSSMVSAKARYDRVMDGKARFSSSEAAGKALFDQHCANCHKPPLFSDFSFRNNGLDSVFKDEGRARITRLAEDSGKFKVPSLRNIGLSAPYMHDGRFETMEQVLAHYAGGIQQASNLDSSLYNMPAFSEAEQRQLLSFLHTLSDYSFVANTAYGPIEHN